MSDPLADWERRFLDQKEVYRQVLDAIADMVLVKGAQSRILWANRAFRDYYGMSNEQLHDIVDAPFNEVDFTAQYVRDDLQVFTTGQTLDITEEPVTRHDGLVQIFHTVKSPIRDADNAVRMTVGVSRNITEQKRTQEDLARHRVHLERLVEERTAEISSLSESLQIILSSLAEGIIAVGADGHVQLMNPAAEAFTGWTSSEAAGRDLEGVLQFRPEEPERAAPLPSAGGQGTLGRLTRSHRRLAGHVVSRDGTRQLVSVHGSPLIGADNTFLGSVVVLRDIALEREVEDQRLRHQKLESVGLLAGGIAHDFNNILTGILGGISIARMRLTTGGNVDDVLEHAENACVRAQGLTTQLLTFARGGAPVKKILRIEDAVRDAADLAIRGSLVSLEFECDSDAYLVEVDEGQIAQTVNNLVLNSKQAMPKGGSIRIRIANATVAEGDQLPLDPGPYVTVSVEDRGPGIAPEHLMKVFDPYFTTKEHGSGLGLASVHSIIERHGGHVAVSSSPGQGARFTIHLPAAACQTTTKATARPSVDSPSPRRLLILDDDATVRDVMKSVLEILGHRVVATARSTEAFEAFDRAREAGEPFDAVFVDLTRPGDLGGGAVVARLREGDPAVKVVVMSGYSTSPLMATARDLGLAGTLQKPFTVEMVRQVLASC